MVDFHSLKKSPANVILSDKFLFEIEAFSQYDCFLVDEDDEDENAFIFAIDLDVSHAGQGECYPYPFKNWLIEYAR